MVKYIPSKHQPKKNAGEIILTSEKVDLRKRNINKDKEDISYSWGVKSPRRHKNPNRELQMIWSKIW